MYLSNGLQAEAIAHSGQPVVLSDGTEVDAYHANCDGGASFPQADGGHIYVSNSEIGSYADKDLSGGVYALTFDAENNLKGYAKLLKDTVTNCHGGETPWVCLFANLIHRSRFFAAGKLTCFVSFRELGSLVKRPAILEGAGKVRFANYFICISFHQIPSNLT
jgi:hypothetical protein